MMQGRLGMGLQCAALPSCSPSTPSPTPSDTADYRGLQEMPRPPTSLQPPSRATQAQSSCLCS